MRLLGHLITKKPVVISLVFLLVLVGLITGATQMKLATGNDTLMSTESNVYKDNQKLEEYFGGETIILLNTSTEENGILTVDNFARMKELEQSLRHYEEIYTIISPASIVEQLTRKQADMILERMTDMQAGLKEMGDRLNIQMGSKLIEISDGLGTVLSLSDIMHPGLPNSQSTLENLLYEDGALRPIFDELILDSHNSIMMIKLQGNANDTTKEAIAKEIEKQLNQKSFTGVDTIVTGKPIMDSAVRTSMQESMQKMIVIAIGIMIVVLLVVFPVRWRVLPIPVILLAVIATLGLMGYVNVPMTMVSMAVFPILIGLGVDYAIQFQNRYEEELAKEESIDVR